MELRRIIIAIALVSAAVACQSTPLDNIWPGCQTCAPTPAPAAQLIPWEVRIDERVSPAVDCNPVRTQHTLVVTVLDQCGNPMPGQRVEWMLARYPEAVGDIVAVDDQYGVGAIAPMSHAYPGNNGSKIDNQYAVSVTNYGPELLDAGNNHPHTGANGNRLPDITIGRGQSWLTITSTREGVTDIIVLVPGIRDGTKHKTWAKQVWADFRVNFPESAMNVLPNDSHTFPVQVVRSDGTGIPGQVVDAEILDGPGAIFTNSTANTASAESDANGVVEFVLKNTSGDQGVNRIRLTARGAFYGEICPQSKIVTKTWVSASLAVECTFPTPTGVVGRALDKVITVTNTGSADAENVVLEDVPGPGLNIADGSSFPMQLGSLAPGQSVSRTVQFTSNAEGEYTNTVRVRDTGSNATAESSCSCAFVQGKLEIKKVCEPAKANAGSEVRFVVTVANTGRGPLENVMVVDQYPEGIEQTSQNTASIPVIPAGESREVVFTGVATEPGAYTNFVRATADGVGEVEDSCTLQVVECKLKMELVGPPNIYYGEDAAFTLNVTNEGDGDADGCTVRVTYGGCLGAGFQDFNIGPLAPGQKWTHDFSQTATTVGQCLVTAESNCGARCEIKQDAEITVTGLTALQVEMTDKALDGTEEGIFRVGESFIYRLRVENDVGTEATPGLVIEWNLPPELEFVTGRSLSGDATVTGESDQAKSSEFSLGVGGYLDFEIQVRVISAPDSSLVKAEALVTRASDGVELASETESTTVKQ